MELHTYVNGAEQRALFVLFEGPTDLVFLLCVSLSSGPDSPETSPSEPIGTAQPIWRAAESQSKPGDKVLSRSLLGWNQIWGKENENGAMF